MQNSDNKFSDYVARMYGLTHYFELVRVGIGQAISNGRFDAAAISQQITTGKMLRPLMLLLSGNLSGQLSDAHISAASAVEIIHYASLVHDDIIDNARTRRDHENIRSQKGDKYAVMFGDWLISTALESILNSDGAPIINDIVASVKSMCEGELLQNEQLFSKEITEQDYFAITSLKTADFFACCCGIGAKLSGATTYDIDKLRRFGECFGTAFQIINDVADFKTARCDIKNGQKTLPQFRSEKFSTTGDAIKSSLQTAYEYLDKAVQYLKDYQTPAAQGLIEICEHFKVEGNKLPLGRYIDVHLHLEDERFDADRGEIIEQAKQVGVEYMLCCSAVEQDWNSVLELSEGFECAIPYLGIHPWSVEQLSAGWDIRLLEAALKNKCGIGEIGLDKQLTKADFDLQCEVFQTQIGIAIKLNRPATMHCLKAYGKLLAILAGYSRIPHGSFIHSYSGSPEMIPEFANLGLMFSYNGKAMDDANKQYIASIEATPLENILLETDAPFMLPAKMSTGIAEARNLPANLPVFAQRIAEIKGISLEELSEAAYKNALEIMSTFR